MEAVIRPAVPEDAPPVARLMHMAGKAHVETSVFDLMIAGTMEHRLAALEKLFRARTPTWFQYSTYLVAEVDGEVAATLCGFNNPESGGAKLFEALVETGWSTDEIVAMGERLQPYSRVNPSLPDDAWVLENVATFPEYRGRGLMNALLGAIIERGREQGYHLFQVAVFIGNEAAQGAYEKAGFRVTDEYADPEFEEIFKAPGMKRLVQTIES